jgi:hypothetical protein
MSQAHSQSVIFNQEGRITQGRDEEKCNRILLGPGFDVVWKFILKIVCPCFSNKYQSFIFMTETTTGRGRQ